MRRELWRTVLSTATRHCFANFDDIPAESPIDVVVTDQEMDDEAQARLAPAGETVYSGGLITVGLADQDAENDVAPQDPVVGPASIALPANATAREMKLGVLLVHQIVQLQRDRGAQNQLKQTYRQLALEDPLTKVANRRAWDDELARRWDARAATDNAFCLALLDVDQLKQVNDSAGHDQGDRVLRGVAGALVASVRDRDFVARLGGDEFGLLLAQLDPGCAQQVVDRIRRSTSRYLASGETSADEVPVTTSAGYAFPLPEESADDLYRRADEALRAAKLAGNNTTVGAPG